MAEISEYQLIAENTNFKLSKSVDKYLKKKWQLYGYPMIVDGIFFQAVVKFSKEKK